MTTRRLATVLWTTAACASLALIFPETAQADSATALTAHADPAQHQNAAVIDTPLVGTWDIVTMAGAPLDEGFTFTFNADGTGEWNDGDVEPEPLAYSYDAETDLYTLQIEEEEVVVFRVTFDGDEATLTPTDEELGYPPLGLRRKNG